LGLGGRRKEGSGGDYITRSLMTRTASKYYSSDQIKKNEMGGHVALWDRRHAYRILVGKPEGRRPLGRLRRRWEDNIKTDL
jgi:hypothetical protein